MSSSSEEHRKKQGHSKQGHSEQDHSKERIQAEELHDHAILEGNVARLIRRAYVPALPVPEFRVRLVTLAREETLRHGHKSLRLTNSGNPTKPKQMHADRPRPLWILASLIAAIALIFVGLRLFLSVEPLPGTRSAAEIVRSGLVAVNWNEEADWEALAIPQGDAVLDLGQGRSLKLSSPPKRAFFARLGLTLGFASPQESGGIRSAPVAPRVVRTKVLEDTSVRLSVQASQEDHNKRDDPAELQIELEHGGLRLAEESGLLVSRAGRIRFDASKGILELESDADGLLIRSRAKRVSVVPLDDQGISTGPARVLPEGSSLLFKEGHFVGDSQTLASNSFDGQRQASRPQERETDQRVASPTHVISVIDKKTGAAINEVTLALVPRAQQNRVAETIKQSSEALDGQHLLHAVPQGQFKLVVFAEGYCLWTGPEQDFDPMVSWHVDVALTRGGSLLGYLVDSVSGNPIAGARVAPRADLPAPTVPFELDPEQLWLPILAETKSDGSFVLPHVSPGEHELQIAAQGFGTRFEKGIQIQADQRTELAPLALDPEAVLAGAVSDQAGALLEGAQVVVAPFGAGSGLSYYSATKTDSDGQYSIGGLADGLFLAISVPDQSSGVPDVRPFRAVSGKTTRIDFGPAMSGSALSGVLSDAQGNALSNVNIALIHRSGGQPSAKDHFRASSTSKEGTYHFDGVSPGEYDLIVVGENNGVCVAGTVSVTGNLEAQTLDLRLGGMDAFGRVLRAADNAPVAGVEVTLLWIEPGQSEACFLADAKTGADGTWRATGLRPGGLLAVCYPGTSGATAAGDLGMAVSQRVEAAEGQAEVDLGSVALFTGGSARVELRDAQDHPLIGMRVEVKTQSGIQALPSSFSTTGAEGEFVMDGLAPGTYAVDVFREDGVLHTSSFSVQAGMETLHRIELD